MISWGPLDRKKLKITSRPMLNTNKMCWWALVCSQIGTDKEQNPACSHRLHFLSFFLFWFFLSRTLSFYQHIFYTSFYSPFLFSFTTSPFSSLLTHQSCHFEGFWWFLSAVMILSLLYPMSNCLQEDSDRSQGSLSITWLLDRIMIWHRFTTAQQAT